MTGRVDGRQLSWLKRRGRLKKSTYQRVELRIAEISFRRMVTVLVRDSMKLKESPLPFQSIVRGSDPGGIGCERGGEGGVGVGRKVLSRDVRVSGG